MSPYLRQVSVPNRLKIAASALLVVPIAVLLLFTAGEVAGGDVSGVQHLAQAAPLILLLVAGWRYPRTAGIALLALGILVLGLWLFFLLRGGPSTSGAGLAAAGIVLFAPPLVAGWLFLKAGRTESGT